MIGEIKKKNIDKVLTAGLTRVAVVRAIINAKSPQNAAEKFCDIVKSKLSC